MGLANANKFVRTVIDGDVLINSMHNEFLVVASRKYTDKKGILPDGKTLTLQVLHNDNDYGIDKETGLKKDNNVFQTFDVTVLSQGEDVKKGDKVALYGFDAEHSFYIDYNLVLRFKEYKKISSGVATNPETLRGTTAPTSTQSVGSVPRTLVKPRA